MMKHRRRRRKARALLELCLYIADTSPRSVLAIRNLHTLCEQHLKARYHVTIIDIVKRPAMARLHNVLATPALVRVRPQTQTTVIGTLADPEKVLRALGLWDGGEEGTSSLTAGFSQVGHA